jgi:hypothetical protein
MAPRYRRANAEDVSAIFAVLEEVACEIPITIGDSDHRARVFGKVKQTCGFGKSLIATDKTGRVVAFLLVEPRAKGNALVLWGEPQPAGLALAYGGVTKSWRNQRIFPAMIERMKRRKRPLFAAVRHDNESHMAERLMKMGFEKVGTVDGEDKFRWMP